MCIFYCYLIKRNGELFIKGLSFDKINWFLFKHEHRSIDFHPELQKYFSVTECLKARKVNRTPHIRLTKAIKSIYFKDNKFCFNKELLEQDNKLKEDSILNQLNQQNLDKEINFKEGDFISSTSYEPIQPKLAKLSPHVLIDNKIRSEDDQLGRLEPQDISSIILKLVKEEGTFSLFNHNPQIYLNKISSSFFNFNLDAIVDKFFDFLDKSMHSWYFSEIYQYDISFEEFKSRFLSYVDKSKFDKINDLSMGLEDYLESIEIEESNQNKLKIYFKSKIYYLKAIFKLNEEDAKLFSLCFLDYATYQKLSPVLRNESAFNSLIDLEDMKLNSRLITDNLEEDQIVVQGINELDKIKKELEECKLENDKLTTENDNLKQQNKVYEESIIAKDAQLQANKKNIKTLQKQVDQLKSDINQKDAEDRSAQ